MLEGLAAWVLNTYVGEYVENLNTYQLSVALLQGAVELENLSLKKDALKSLGLPLHVKSGFIGKIKLKIPLRRLRSEPWVISVENLHLVAGPLQNTEYDEGKEKAEESARKQKLLDTLEAKMRGQKLKQQESSSWFSFGTSIIANILENLQLTIKDVHIRYEDDDLNPACPFAFGVVIKELSAQSTDGQWVPKFVRREKVDRMHKLVDLKDFAVYLDTNTTLVGHLSRSEIADFMQSEMYVSSITNKFKEHGFLLLPASLCAKMKRHTTALPLRNVDEPRITMDLNLENMAFKLSENQYRNMVYILKEFDKYELRKRFKKQRPNVPVINNARTWWKFAIEAKLSTIQERNRRRTKSFMLERAKNNVQYTRMYMVYMSKENVDRKMKAVQAKVEEEYSFNEIKILRELVYRQLRQEEALSRKSSPQPKHMKENAAPKKGKSWLQNWFPGWGGWHKPAKPEPETSSVEMETCLDPGGGKDGELHHKITKTELEEEWDHVIEDFMGNGEDDKSILKRDAVFAKLNFCLDSGSFHLLGSRTDQSNGDWMEYSILKLKCTAIRMVFESRPRTSGLTFGFSVGGLDLIDKLTKNSVFPCLVGTQNKEILGPKRHGSGSRIQKVSRISTVIEGVDTNLLHLVYEKNPFGTPAHYRIVVETKPLDIVYNATAFRKIFEIFSSKNLYMFGKSETFITAAARRQYEALKKQARDSLTQLLEAPSEMLVRRWDIQLDISAPQIIVPENFQNENTPLVVLDLGHVKFHSTPETSLESQSDGNNEDEFLTPMSTPPNELEETPRKTVDIDDLSQMNLTEKDFYRKLYDPYTLKLQDLQMMAGNMKDSLCHIHHLIDRFSISLQIERRLIYTTDPQWPTVIISGTLPSLIIRVNEHKVHTVNNCLKALSIAREQNNLSPISGSKSLTESSCGSNLENEWESTPVDYTGLNMTEEGVQTKMQKVFEESQLLRMQFSINKVSLEIHSREHKVAELQVAGVNTSLTKRSYDTAVTLSMHSLQVMDALQTYGQDFELLAASHRNASCYTESQDHYSASPTDDREALITVDFEIFSAKSQRNTKREGQLTVANFHFNNLDIIANQKTVVEILGFLKRTLPETKRPLLVETDTSETLSKSTVSDFHCNEEEKSRMEVTAEFNRLSVLLIRPDESTGGKVAKKVATVTMSCARLKATLNSDLIMTGSLGGFNVFDITSEVKHHKKVFSVGRDPFYPTALQSIFLPKDMYKTAGKSALLGEMGSDSKALSFSYSRPIRRSGKNDSFCYNKNETLDGVDDYVHVSVEVASMCYTHSPRTVVELIQCFSELKDYWTYCANSLKNVAKEVAKGMIARRQDQETDLEYPVNLTLHEPKKKKKSRIIIDAKLDSPVIIVPKSASSQNVLVAHLGQMSISNKDEKRKEQSSCDLFEVDTNPGRVFMEVKDMNLYALNLDTQCKSAGNFNNQSYSEFHDTREHGMPIMYDTTIQVTIDHTAVDASLVNSAKMEPNFDLKYDMQHSIRVQEKHNVLDIHAKIQTPIKLELSKNVYEQILQTTDYMLSAIDEYITVDQGMNVNSNASVDNEAETSTMPSNDHSFSFGSLDYAKDSCQSQSVAPFITKKFRFEVPLVSVELKDDFGDGEQGIVELKLDRFLLDFLKDKPATAQADISLKSLMMEDLQVAPDSPHRQIMVSNTQRTNPCRTPPSRCMARSMSHNETIDEHLVYISVLYVDKASPEYTERYNQTMRFINVDFSSLDTTINQHTWVVLLDFLGLGAKVHDLDTLAGKGPKKENKPQESEEFTHEVVNSEVKLKISKLSIHLNKPEYLFAEATVSSLTSHVSLRDGNFHIHGQLGKVIVLDQSSSGQFYRERFMSVGEQAMEFDFFKYGIPDPLLHREYDMRMKLRMASVRYTHTNKFQAEMLAFVQHFLQLQDVMGRMRAAAAGKEVNGAAFHSSRLLLDIKAGSPIILIPHSSCTSDVLVADLGTLSVKNVFRFDGDRGTFNVNKSDVGTSMVLDKGNRCLLDVLNIILTDMDLFTAKRVEKTGYREKKLQQDLEFPSCVIQRQESKLLKEKCVLNLRVERNLEDGISHDVPDFRVEGALSSVHCCLDIKQYKLIRGLLDHNLGEEFENFKMEHLTHMHDPPIQTFLSCGVWTVISFAVDLNNVTLELLTSLNQGQSQSEVSLAKLDFIRSRLSYKLFSDQSMETDLISKEILASDTRFRDVAISQRSSAFEHILQPTKDASRDSLQMELHYSSNHDGAEFRVNLSNMKILCSFDWLIELQEFITTKPENPFLTDHSLSKEELADVQMSNQFSSCCWYRTTNKSDVPFEFKLNMIKTQFVMVENLALLDTNAVILKCTSVLSFRPKAPDKLLSCTVQNLEVFSCCLQSEDETALSIVDPMSVTIELKANPCPSPSRSGTTAVEQRKLLLEVDCYMISLRLSYQDMNLFLAILNSVPQQALQACRSKSVSLDSEFSEAQLEPLLELGFNAEDCQQALKTTVGIADDAAVWLLENAKPFEHRPYDMKITCIDLNVNTFCLCLIDDCQDADVPLVEITLHGDNMMHEFGKEGRAGFQVTADYYNRNKSGWEPMLEQWRCQAHWKNLQAPEKKLVMEISATDILNINITRPLLDLYNLTKDKWTEDYYKNKDSSRMGLDLPSRVKRRNAFAPYAIRNHTGCLVWFIPVTTNPSDMGKEASYLQGSRLDKAYVQGTEWLYVPPNDEVNFNFHGKVKMRHKKSDSLRVNQLLVVVEGWQRLSPLPVDKVGVYFRNTRPYKTRHSTAQMNDQQLARVVFDVKQEGTAKKVITIRSALIVANRLDSPVEVKMDSPTIRGSYDYITVNPNQQKPVPMTFVASRLWMRPSDWPVNHCDHTIQWQHVKKPGEVTEHMRECNMPGCDGLFRFCVGVRRELYPEEVVPEGLHPLPGHTLIILPTVTICNLLPIDTHYYLKGTQISGVIKPGKWAHLSAADISQDMRLGINIENFRSKELTIPAGTKNNTVKLGLYDVQDRLLELFVGIKCRIGGSLKLSISSQFWLVNRTGLPLVFRQDGATHEAAGQLEDHEIASITSPLLFSSKKKDCKMCMRIGKGKHGMGAISQWCQSFALDKEYYVRQLHVEKRNKNWVYNIGIDVKPGKGQFRKTAIATFSSRFHIDNQSGHSLAIAQRQFINKEALDHPDGILIALPNCKMPFHWPRHDFDQLLCVKLLETDGCNWSGGFRIDKDDSFHINMRDARKLPILLKVDVLLIGQTFNIVFTDDKENPPPFQLHNMSEIPVQYYQTKTQEERLRAILRPKTCVPYALDEPTLDPYLTLSVSNGTTATYSMAELGEGEQLSYQNLIYITITATFPRSGTMNTNLQTKKLVLDCEHDNHVIFKKLEPGKRSQLWRMTESGMLENKGKGQPRGSSSARSGERYVLDIADRDLRPGRPVPLALKKAAVQRDANQIWAFKDGMLCSPTGNFCVQSLWGMEGLQDGARAMLGQGPEEGSLAPIFMQVSSLKLHPGSGSLAVRISMDGPVRVVQIYDVKQRTLVQLNKNEEDCEIHRKLFDHKTNEQRKTPIQKRIELNVDLKAGIGLSLVNNVPEELLYLTLQNITILYRANPENATMEMSVANIQADNQLFRSSRSAVLFVTPQSRRDAAEDTPALHISAHKKPNISWNADIYKHLIISMKKLTIQLEEILLWKLVQFSGIAQSKQSQEELVNSTDDLQKTLAELICVKSKRIYFGVFCIQPTCVTLSLLTSSVGLPMDLKKLKRSYLKICFNFGDVKVELEKFRKHHMYETKERLLNEIKVHYEQQLWRHSGKIIGSMDIFGSPLCLKNDIKEGISVLKEDGNFSGFAKGVFHGISNTTSKVADSLSEGLNKVHMDKKHNAKRQQIQTNAKTSGKQIKSGLKGLGHGLYGGLKGVVKPIEGAREKGAEGFAKGLYTGITGVVTKPVAGLLDFTSGMSNAVRDECRLSTHMQPGHVRESRCCHGPGGLLPPYSRQQAQTQALLYKLNDHAYNEILIMIEPVHARSAADIQYVLITNLQVYFLRNLNPHKSNIILNIKHGDYSQCRNFESEGRFYVEILMKGRGSNLPYDKKPQICCGSKIVSQKVSQQINYAKKLFDEQTMTLTLLPDIEDDI